MKLEVWTRKQKRSICGSEVRVKQSRLFSNEAELGAEGHEIRRHEYLSNLEQVNRIYRYLAVTTNQIIRCNHRAKLMI